MKSSKLSQTDKDLYEYCMLSDVFWHRMLNKVLEKFLSCTLFSVFLKAEPSSHFLFAHLFICNSILRVPGLRTEAWRLSIVTCFVRCFLWCNNIPYKWNIYFISLYIRQLSSLGLISHFHQVLMWVLLSTVIMWLSTDEQSFTFAWELWGTIQFNSHVL